MCFPPLPPPSPPTHFCVKNSRINSRIQIPLPFCYRYEQDIWLHISSSVASEHDHLLVPFCWHFSARLFFSFWPSRPHVGKEKKGCSSRQLTQAHEGAAGCTFAAALPHTAGCICPSCVLPFHTVRPVKCQVSRTPAQVCVCTVCMYVCMYGGGGGSSSVSCEMKSSPAVAFSPLIVMITGWPSHSAWYWARNSPSDIMRPAGWRASRLYSRGRRGNL